MRDPELVSGEYYHIFNHGIDKANITLDQYDSDRFVQCLMEFNSTETKGGIYLGAFNKKGAKKEDQESEPLVDVLTYCLNPNHFHLLVHQNIDEGIQQFMHRVTMGYSKYINTKYKRKGSLFRGPFKAVYVKSDDQLLYTTAYVAYNNKIHKLGHAVSKLIRSNADHLEKLPDDPRLSFLSDRFKNRDEYDEYIREVVKISQGVKMDQGDLDDN